MDLRRPGKQNIVLSSLVLKLLSLSPLLSHLFLAPVVLFLLFLFIILVLVVLLVVHALVLDLALGLVNTGHSESWDRKCGSQTKKVFEYALVSVNHCSKQGHVDNQEPAKKDSGRYTYDWTHQVNFPY